MRSTARLAALCMAASLALLAASGTAAAAPKLITGKLSKPGYTVFGLAKNGKANSVQPEGRRFGLRPPAKVVTLHLRAKDGTYAGPVVVAREKKGKRAILGVKAGAELGEVEIKPGKGYAKVKKELPERRIDEERKARAKNGVPIGAGVFGRVRSKRTHGGAPGDQDLDGLPNPLDVDDNGNLVLDNLDTSGAEPGARSTGTDPCGPGRIYCQDISSSLGLHLEQTVNANAGSSNEQINAALATFGTLRIRIGAFTEQLPGGRGDSAELDCGDPDTGLAYCRQNGSTGRSGLGGGPQAPFPGEPGGAWDPDGDGFGNLGPSGGGPNDFFLVHGAQARVPGLDPSLDDPSIPKIGTSDVLTQWVTTGGDPAQCPPLSATCASFPAVVQYVIATVPTLVSYDDAAGHSATVAYPTPTTQHPPPHIAPGTEGHGFPVSDSPDDADTDVELALTFWRQQRKPIVDPDPAKGEKCPTPADPDRLCTPDDWIDIGGLTYAAAAGATSSSDPSPGGGCPQSSFSSADPQLSPPSIPPVIGFSGGFTDSAPDRPADPGNTFTYELNLTQCLAAHGGSFGVGEERGLNFSG